MESTSVTNNNFEKLKKYTKEHPGKFAACVLSIIIVIVVILLVIYYVTMVKSNAPAEKTIPKNTNYGLLQTNDTKVANKKAKIQKDSKYKYPVIYYADNKTLDRDEWVKAADIKFYKPNKDDEINLSIINENTTNNVALQLRAFYTDGIVNDGKIFIKPVYYSPYIRYSAGNANDSFKVYKGQYIRFVPALINDKSTKLPGSMYQNYQISLDANNKFAVPINID